MSIVSAMKGVAFKTAFVLKKHAPQILIATGIASGIASTIMAARGTVIALDAMKEHEDNKKKISNTAINSVLTVNDEKITYTEELRDQDLKTESVHTVIDVVKAYAPAIGLGILSITATLSGFHVMSTRFATCAAALNAVTKSYSDYRKRVTARYGKDVDYQLVHGLEPDGSPRTIEVTNDDGSTETKQASPEYSIYMKIFDSGNINWNDSPELNVYMLRSVENMLNDKLRIRGHLFLNEAYDALGFNRTRLGSVAGWTYDEKNPRGDNMIDIGLSGPGFNDFVNGFNNALVLDFNAQGCIIDDIETHQFVEG